MEQNSSIVYPEKDKMDNELSPVKINGETVLRTVEISTGNPPKPSIFYFDRVFPQQCTQESVSYLNVKWVWGS